MGVKGRVGVKGGEGVGITLFVDVGMGAVLLGVEMLEYRRDEKDGGAGSWGIESWMPESPCVVVGRIT